MRLIRIGVVLLFVSGCSGAGKPEAKEAETPKKSAEGQGPGLTAGTPVCFGEVLPMRYILEDALAAHELNPVDSCAVAEVRIKETGEPGKYVLRYQRIGDDGWETCESDSQDRTAFLEVCTNRLVDEVSSGPQAGAGD